MSRSDTPHITKNSMIFKTWLTDLTKIQGVANNIKNLSTVVDGATGLLNPNVVNSLSAAINGLNLQQAQLALSTKNLTQEQMNQILVQAGLKASEDQIQAELVQSALVQAGLSAEKQRAILIKAGLMNATTNEIFTTKACTKEELLNTLATKGVTGANAEAIISALGLTGANEGLSISFDVLSASIKQTMVALTMNPMTWIAALAATIYLTVKAIEYFNDSLEDVAERIETNQNSLSEYTSKVEELTSKLEELNATDVTYFSDSEKQELETEKQYVQSQIDLYNQLIEAKQKVINQDSIKAVMGENEKIAIKKLWSELTSGDWEGMNNTQKEIFGKANPFDYILTSGLSVYLKNVDDGNYFSEADKLFEEYQQLQDKYASLENLAIQNGNNEFLVEKADETSSKMIQVAADIATYIEQISAARDELVNSANSDDYVDEIAKMEEAIEKYQSILNEDIYESKYAGYTDLQRDLLGIRDALNAIASTEGLENSNAFNSVIMSINQLIEMIGVLNTYSLPEIFELYNLQLTDSLNILKTAFDNLETKFLNGELFDEIKDKLNGTVPPDLIEKWENLKIPIEEVVSKLEELISYISDETGITDILNNLRISIENMFAPLLIFIDKYSGLFGKAKEAWDEAHSFEYSKRSKSDSKTDKETDSASNSNTFIDTLNSSDYADIKEELLELAKSGEITPETLSSTKEYNELLKKTGTSAESATNQILDMLSRQEKLSALSQGLDKLQTSYEEFKDIGFVTAETLQSLPDAFKNLPEYDLFSQIVGDPTSGAEAIQQAFNDITKAYLLSQDTLQGLVNANEHDIQSYIANFKQAGVTNAEEIVNLAVQALNQENALINNAQGEFETEYQKYLQDKSYDYEEYLQNQSSQNSALVGALGRTYKADYDNWCELLSEKGKAYNRFINALEESGITYDSNKSIYENAQEYIKEHNYSPAAIDTISRYASEAELAEYKADKFKDQLKLDLSQITTDFGTNYSPSSFSSRSKDESSSQPSKVTQEFNWLENYLEKFAKATERITNKISDYLSFKKNQSTIKSALKAIRDEYSANEKALQKYEEQMEAIGLSQTYIDKIKNGDLNTETITGYETDGNKDTNAQLIEKIQLYQDLYDKSEEIRDKLTELGETEKEWLIKNLELIEEYYSSKANLISDQIDEKESEISLKEASGKVVKTSDYNSLVSKTKQEISALNTEYEKVTAEFNKLVRNGTIEKDSNEWFSWQKTISKLTQEIASSQEELIEWQEAINQLKIDGYTSSIDRLQTKYEKLNTIISRKESSHIVATQSDYNKVISNLNKQISKNNTLLEYYKQLQAQTEKNSKKWKEYQQLIEQTESTVESLKDSIIETAQKTADIIAEKRNLKLDDNENTSNLLSAKYDNATTASEKNKILAEQDALAKNNLDINKQAYNDYITSTNNSGAQLSQYVSNATGGISEANSLIADTQHDLQKEKERYGSYANAYAIAQEKYSNATTKEEKSSAKAEIQNLSAMMDESTEKIKVLEAALSSYNADLEANQSIVSQLDDYEFGKEIDLSKITDEKILKVAAQYNENLKNQKQAFIDAGLSEQEYIKTLRENASQRIQNCLDEYEALNKLNKAQRDNINAKISLNKTQGYTITDGEYETYIKSSQESIKLAQKALNKAQAEFDRNLANGLYENNEEQFIEDKANLESAKANLYELWEDGESMLDGILQLRIDALTEEKEALQKLYELQERRYKLEEAQYNLEKAKQRTNLVYNGDEFVYQADANTLKQAEKALEEAQHNEVINKIDDVIESIENAKKDINLYDADGNALGNTEDIIKVAAEIGDNAVDSITNKSNDNKFDTTTETLEDASIVPLKNEELIFTQEQGSQLQQKFSGISPVFSDSLHLKPTIPAPVDVNAASHIEINMNGDMQFNEVQNVNDLSKAIVNGQLRSSMKRELGRLKM